MTLGQRLKSSMTWVFLPVVAVMIVWEYVEKGVVTGQRVFGIVYAALPLAFVTSILEHLVIRAVGDVVNKHRE